MSTYLKEIEDIKKFSMSEVSSLSTRLNSYIAISSALLLLYLFQNMDILKKLPLSNNLLFLMTIIPLLNTLFAIFTFFYTILVNSEIISVLLLYKEIKELAEKDKSSDLEDKLLNLKQILLSKKSKELEAKEKNVKFIYFVISLLTLSTFIEVGYIFYLLIYKI